MRRREFIALSRDGKRLLLMRSTDVSVGVAQGCQITSLKNASGCERHETRQCLIALFIDPQ
jgi:hypothetical protein